MRQLKLIVVTIFLFLPLTTNASLITFELKYSGADWQFGPVFIDNNITAWARLTVDTDKAPAPADPYFFFGVPAADVEAVLGFTDFFIQVSGAPSGNGWFGISEIAAWVSVSTGMKDLSMDLVPQVLDENGDLIVLCPPDSPTDFCIVDDFNFFPVDGSLAPCGVEVGALIAGGCQFFDTEQAFFDAVELSGMRLISYKQIPEPGTIALLGLGLAGIGIARRRKAYT